MATFTFDFDARDYIALMRMLDVTGQVFGRWTVESRADNSPAGQARWNCRCACGNTGTILSVVLRDGRSRSCGCLKIDEVVARSTKHGLTPMGGKQPPTYVAWASMVKRCTNPKCRAWKNYGGRGITVCERWRDFALFLADMGERPAGRASIDRIDNSRGYEPGNCRWADDRTQARNKRNNRRMTLDGETMLMCEWAERIGIPATVIGQRVFYGWSDKRALTEPLRRRRPRLKPE